MKTDYYDDRDYSRPTSSGGNLTPQTLADHTNVQESIHERHVDVVKSVLPMENENDVGVIEYLDTLPTSNAM